MIRTPVDSSNLAAVGYDPDTGTLEVEFRPSKLGFVKVWEYFPVKPDVYDAMLDRRNSAGHILALIKTDPLITARLIDTIEVPA
jgi:hypothetical protein